MSTQVETLAAPPAKSAASPSVSQPHSAKPSSPWIYGPVIDLLVGCGAWSAPLLLIAALVTPSHTHAWAVAFYALAIIFNYPHFMATEYRAYRSKDDFRKYKFFTLHLTLLLVLTGILAHTFPALVPWIVTLYIWWSPWHYTGQNYGLLLMFVRRGGATIESAERRWLRAAFVASYLMLMAGFQTGVSNDHLVLSLGLPARYTIPARAILGAAFAIFSAAAFHGLVKRSGWRAMLAPLTLLATQFLWFVLPTMLELNSAYQIPQTRYSSGILAVLHSAQYLWITSYYQSRDARAAGELTGQSKWKMSGYFVALIAGGIALFIPGPWLVSYIFRFDFTTSFLIFTALVNIHHFMLDGAIWKLRDSRVASRLISQSQQTQSQSKAGAEAHAAKVAPSATRFFRTPAFRIAVVGLLFLWAGTDQIRFALGTSEGNFNSLSRAARLTPYDSAVEERIATTQMAQGQPNDAITSYSRALAINPTSPQLNQEMARALIQDGRYAEADDRYQKLLAVAPNDADALTNFGVLATQLGHPDEAVSSWQKAIVQDPQNPSARLYLAEALDQRADYAGAAKQWYAFLQLAAAQKSASGAATISPENEIAALVQLSDDEARQNQLNAAITGYRSATALASRSANAKLESLAFARMADAQEKQGDSKSAADSFQRALAADEKSADPASSASDWFNYAQFLTRHNQSSQLAYACLLQAENLLSSDTSQTETLNTIQSVRKSLEAKLGLQASAEARKNQSTLVSNARSLPPNSF